jgi:hypothetical protein
VPKKSRSLLGSKLLLISRCFEKEQQRSSIKFGAEEGHLSPLSPITGTNFFTADRSFFGTLVSKVRGDSPDRPTPTWIGGNYQMKIEGSAAANGIFHRKLPRSSYGSAYAKASARSSTFNSKVRRRTQIRKITISAAANAIFHRKLAISSAANAICRCKLAISSAANAICRCKLARSAAANAIFRPVRSRFCD